MPVTNLDRFVRLNVVGLFWGFVVVGTLFFLVPDGVVAFTDRVGAWFGDFPQAPQTGFRLWLSLTTGYMVLVSLLAYLIQRDIHGNRSLLLVLAAGKLTSSVTCLLFYMFSLAAFGYLLNFLVDGSIVLNCLLLYRLLDPSRRRPGFPRWLERGGRGRSILTGVLATMLPDAADEKGAGGAESADFAEDVLDYLRGFGPAAPRALVPALLTIEYGTILWFGTLRPFTRLDAAERERYLRGFENSRFYLRERVLFPIRLLATTLFYSRPEQEAVTGYERPRIDRSGAAVQP
ncbi:MAG: hypothetical protein B6D46_00545 [Polyangiaceae bacterium UTPRO1]|jgi:hypothetical protein|nr:hypothetical protein [Myxococcales bacterium]OQY69230.1 MAG: hypothetical protein B6D46_00545 [Polyangiaceae bacterium UTPRO1]